MRNAPDETSLPTGWTVAAFTDLVTTLSDEGKRLPAKKYEIEGPHPVVDQGEELIGGYTNQSDLCLDLPLPVIVFGDHTRRFKLIGFPFVVGAQGVKLLKPKQSVAPRYLWYQLRAAKFPDRGYSRHFQFVRKLELRVAPEKEQQRIVEAIETLFSRLDAAVAALKRVQANLKRYRASVLKAACEGRLVPTEAELASQEGRDYEPADKLLERILRERRKRWEEQEWGKHIEMAKKKLAKHVKRNTGKDASPHALNDKAKYSAFLPKNDKWKSKYKEPQSNDAEMLPDGWAWANVEMLGRGSDQEVLTGPFGTSLGRGDFLDEGVPVLTIGCLTESGIDLSKACFISPEKSRALSKYRLQTGDMLFSRMASVGRAGFVTRELEGALFNYHIMRLRLSQDCIDPNYFLSWVRGAACVQDYIRGVNHGQTRDGINTIQLLSMPVAVPPVDEQRRIVEETDRVLSVIGETELATMANLKRAERLRQAILKRAFEGRLVPTEAELAAAEGRDYETAEQLLARIKAKHSEPTRKKPPRKRKQKPKKPTKKTLIEEA